VAAQSSFEACVIARESGGNPTAVNPVSGAAGLYQFLPSTWADYDGYPSAADAPASVQQQYFDLIYAAEGTAPWAPFDGC
jgi:muramidase (phage lysozyme)